VKAVGSSVIQLCHRSHNLFSPLKCLHPFGQGGLGPVDVGYGIARGGGSFLGLPVETEPDDMILFLPGVLKQTYPFRSGCVAQQ
jgi:hypothetical protein